MPDKMAFCDGVTVVVDEGSASNVIYLDFLKHLKLFCITSLPLN